MAEFKEVMKQYKRMCCAYPSCADCPFSELGWRDCCSPSAAPLGDDEDMDIWETTVMEWAHTHPEPKRPTIGDMLYFIGNEMNVPILNSNTTFANFLNNELPKTTANKLVEWLKNKGE